MSAEYYDVLKRSKHELIEREVLRLKNSRAPNYQGIDLQLLYQRATRLVEVFLDSFADSEDCFVSYLKDVVSERITEGYELIEILGALNILEEKAWEIVFAKAYVEDMERLLHQITTTIGAAKNQIAHLYVENKKKISSD
jgi:hypothetical protein